MANKKQKLPRARPNDTIEDLHADDMLTSRQPWHKPRERKKKQSA